MIDKRELLTTATRVSLQPHVIEKDYVLGWMLADILWLVGRGSWHVRRAVGLASKRERSDPMKFAQDLVLGDLKALFDGTALGLLEKGKHA